MREKNYRYWWRNGLIETKFAKICGFCYEFIRYIKGESLEEPLPSVSHCLAATSVTNKETHASKDNTYRWGDVMSV